MSNHNQPSLTSETMATDILDVAWAVARARHAADGDSPRLRMRRNRLADDDGFDEKTKIARDIVDTTDRTYLARSAQRRLTASNGFPIEPGGDPNLPADPYYTPNT